VYLCVDTQSHPIDGSKGFRHRISYVVALVFVGGRVANQTKRLAKDARRILKACRSCKALFFCRNAECPVCDALLAVCSEKEGDLTFPTLDSLAKHVLRVSATALRQQLELKPQLRRKDLKYANVGFDPTTPHFLERQKRIGVCDFCKVISTGKESCHLCQRQKRFTLSEVDLALPLSRDLNTAASAFRRKLEGLGLSETQMLALVRIHTFGVPYERRSDIRALNDLIIKHSLQDANLDQFLSDVVDIVDSCSDEEFREVVLAVELKRAKLPTGLLEQVWSSSEKLQDLWGPFSSQGWISCLRSAYSSHYDLFQDGLALIQDSHWAENERKRRQRVEAEFADRLSRYETEREQITRIKEVSDWWLGRVDDPFPAATKPGYSARSWKHRFRKPW